MADYITGYPYSAVVRLNYYIGGSSYQATCVLIAPDEVLTAGTNLLDATVGGAAYQITAIAGYNGSGPSVISVASFSYHDNNLDTSAGGFTAQQAALDFGVVHFAKPITTAGTSTSPAGYMGLQAGFTGGVVNVAGYPTTSLGGQYEAAENVTLVANTSVFSGTVFDDGAYGSPIWVNSAAGPQVVGLYTGPLGSGAGGYVQLTSTDIAEIDGWIQQDDPGYQPPSAQVAQMYMNILGRVADSGGLNFWTSQLEQTGSATQIETDLAASGEGQAALENAYQNVLGRNPDPGGQAYFSNLLGHGSSLPGVTSTLAHSSEGQADLNAAYETMLGRAADAGGQAYFTQVLSAGGSLAGVRAFMAGSQEEQSVLQTAFANILNRAANAGELAQYTQVLSAGGTLPEVQGMIASGTEATSRIAALLQQDFGAAPTIAQINSAQLQLSLGMTFSNLAAQTQILAENPSLVEGAGSIANGSPQIFDFASNEYDSGTVFNFNPSIDIVQVGKNQIANFSTIANSENLVNGGTGILVTTQPANGQVPMQSFGLQSTHAPFSVTQANFRFV